MGGTLGRSILPCSLSWRAGVLNFVEAEDFDVDERVLHVLDFLDDSGNVQIPPRSTSFACSGHAGSATVSLPKTLLRRFCLLRSVSHGGKGMFVSVRLFDVFSHQCVYTTT